MCLCLKENIFGTLCLWKDAKCLLPITQNSEDTKGLRMADGDYP